jgi:hypothetical protein
MKRNAILLTIIFSIASIIIPIIWGQFQKENKELTIEEMRRFNVGESFGEEFTIYINDSIKMSNSTIVEYNITNTGNTTLIGVGAQSDILHPSNKIPIAGDSVYIKLEDTKIVQLDSFNYLTFAQIRPQESFTILCATAYDTKERLLIINDRDLMNTNIVFKASDERLTTFEKTPMKTKWGQVTSYMVIVITLLILVSVFVIDLYSNIMTKKRKVFWVIWYTIWLLSCLYILSLPIRWLL